MAKTAVKADFTQGLQSRA